MENKCLGPGHWEIENYTVMKREDGEGWRIMDWDRVLVEVPNLNAAREWIAAEIDSIDLGMGGHK